MANLIVAVIVLLVIVAAIAYIVKEKKKGVRCIGCPAAGTCASHNCEEDTCSCHTDTEL